MNLNKYLKQLDFSEKEIKVYTLLLKMGRLTPAAIAKLTKINRATVYSTAKNLIAKGVIAEDLGGKTLYFIALPPENLKQLLTKQKQELQEKEKLVNQAIREVQLVNASGQYPVPKIRFIEEGDLEEFLHKQSPIWNASAEQVDNTWWGFQDHHLIEQYEKWLHWLWKNVHKKTTVKMFSNENELEIRLKSKYPNRKIKTLPNNRFSATTWVVGEYLIMVVTNGHPYYLVEIHDSTLSQNMREVFRNLWENS